MHSDDDFLAAVAANPQDQLTRLVYADWLDEQGDPRGELVRIEEEVRFEPAWSDVLWSQKPRRNELRAKCDPAWLTAMRYGTDCLPLFYGRPFPDHWRDGWRLIREATERWLGHPMPDVGGHADEVAAVEKRLGLTLPPSVREFVAFAHDLPQHEGEWIRVFRDPYRMVPVPGQQAISLIQICEGNVHWGVRRKDLNQADPPVYSYLWLPGRGYDRYFRDREDPPSQSLTIFLFDYAYGYASHSAGSLMTSLDDVTPLLELLRSTFPSCTHLEGGLLFETANLSCLLRVPWGSSAGHISVNVARSIPLDAIPNFLLELTSGGGGFSGLFADEMHRRQPPPEWMRRHIGG